MLVVPFKTPLRPGQGSTERVVDEIQHEGGVSRPIPQPVEQLQPADALVEGAATALLVDILRRIAGKRCDDVDALLGKESRGVLLPGLEEDRRLQRSITFRPRLRAPMTR